MTDFRNSEEWAKAQRGELYTAFVPELIAARARAAAAVDTFNDLRDPTRRQVVQALREVTMNPTPLPPPAATPAEDDALFLDEPWVDPPLRADYGVNIILGKGSYVNSGAVFIDTCPIVVGARTLFGPRCNLYSGTHPLDPAVRNGLKGPETGKPISIGDDCWLGGNVTVLPGVTIGRGCTVGAGSVVTKDVPPFHLVAGNPARIIRKIESAWDPDSTANKVPASAEGVSGPERAIAEASPGPVAS